MMEKSKAHGQDPNLTIELYQLEWIDFQFEEGIFIKSKKNSLHKTGNELRIELVYIRRVSIFCTIKMKE